MVRLIFIFCFYLSLNSAYASDVKTLGRNLKSNDLSVHENAKAELVVRANRGDVLAQRILGAYYAVGPGADKAKAVEYLEKAANQGDGISCILLGDIYFAKGGSFDKPALDLFSKANRLFVAGASERVAICHRTGRGCKKSISEAVAELVRTRRGRDEFVANFLLSDIHYDELSSPMKAVEYANIAIQLYDKNKHGEEIRFKIEAILKNKGIKPAAEADKPDKRLNRPDQIRVKPTASPDRR